MTFGFKIVQEMADGLSEYMDSMGFKTTADFQGRALPTITDWQYLNLNSISKAVIDQDKCIECGRCHIACEDTSHQAITATKDGKRHFEVKEDECVGCNLCVTVCPVPECITLRTLVPGEVDARTGQAVVAQPANWTAHPNNPMRVAVPA
jgi:dihydropyrimidine dehydrogenase (NAD+) subunit PreA